MPDNCCDHVDELRGSIRCATLQPVHRFALVIALVTALFATACSGDDNAGGQRTLPTARPAPTIAGRVVDGFAPGVDDRVAIIGVSATQTLSMRALPGVEQPVVTEVPSTARDLFGFGEAFETPDGRLWWLVRYGNAQGWIEPGAAYLGAPNDVSVRVAGTLATTTYPTMEALVQDVGSQYGSDYIVVGTTPISANGETITTIDVLSNGDDALAGDRIVIIANANSDEFRLTEAREIPLCARGIDDAGICV